MATPRSFYNRPLYDGGSDVVCVALCSDVVCVGLWLPRVVSTTDRSMTVVLVLYLWPCGYPRSFYY